METRRVLSTPVRRTWGGMFLALCLVGSSAYVGWAGDSLPLDDLVARVQARYDRTSHLRARFHQEVELQGFDQVQSGEGQVWMLKPGMMRWEYVKPERQTIIANGETLWIYVPDDRQVMRERLSDTLQSRTPALFLAGTGKLTELFTVTQPFSESSSEDGMLTLQLHPKRGQGYLSQMSLGIDPTSYLTVKVTMSDPLGNVTTLVFSEIDTNVEIDPSLFQFRVPPGVEVVTPPSVPTPR